MSFRILLAGVGLASVLFACGGSTSDGDAAQSQAGAGGTGTGGSSGAAGGAGSDAGGAGGGAGTGVSGGGSGGTGLGSAGAGSGGSGAAGAGGQAGQAPPGSGGGKPAASAAEIAQLCDGLCKTLDAKNAEVGCAPTTTCASSCEPTISAFFASCVTEYAALVDCAKGQPASGFTCDPKQGAQLKDDLCVAEGDALATCAGF